MIQRAVEVLAPVTEQVVVVSSRPVDGTGGATVIPDLIPDRGPLGGLHAALHHAHAAGMDGVLILACDLPLVDEAIVAALAGRDDVAVAPSRDGAGGRDGIEPLCAVYALDVLPAVERRIECDDLSLHALFREVDGRIVELGAGAFINVNTPADRDRAEAALNERESE
jgi:molybdopterin-guanine dinucleotide biosynthesis protein A